MMVRLRKEDTADLDIDELDSIEYSTETFESYDGDVPPKDLELTGYVKKMWWTRTTNNDPMLKILWIAEENTEELEEYNGCPFWLNYALIGGAKFRWAPFLDNYGLTLKQIKNNIDVAEKDDQNGAPINKIGNWKPGEESDEAWCRIVTGRERYNGEWKPAVAEWLPYDTDEDEGEAGDEEYDDEPEEEPEDEPEPEPEPARGRGRSKPVAASRTAEPARGSRTTRATEKTPEKAATARGQRGARTAAPAKGKAAAAPARGARSAPTRGRGRPRGDDSEPPF